eukprot:EG_transcript_7694
MLRLPSLACATFSLRSAATRPWHAVRRGMALLYRDLDTPPGASLPLTAGEAAHREQLRHLHPNRPAQPLSQQLLQDRDAGVPWLTIPTYPRTAECFVCHVGVGGFHRAHQAHYTHRLLQWYADHPAQRPAERFGICGVGLRPRVSVADGGDEVMCEVLQKQDFLYTLVLRSADGTDGHVIGSIMDFVLAPRDFRACVERLAQPSTRIVSLTVTEKGYFQTPLRRLNTAHAAIEHDLRDPDHPATIYGLLASSLRLRKQRGQPPYTLMSCDNMPENGDTLRQLLLQFLELCDPSLCDWVAEYAAFPNTMVDRITPVTEERHKELLAQDFGVADQWPVFAEHFTQWVIEDHFTCGRPEWERVGALFVPDVKPYEYMKLRLLNGTHSALAYFSYLAGHRVVDVALADPVIATFVQGYLRSVQPCIPEVPGVDLDVYAATLVQRFSNAYIKDQVVRLTEDGSQKLPATMKDPILELSRKQLPTQWLALAVAGFLQFMSGRTLDDQPIDCIRDPLAEPLRPACQAACVSGDVQLPLELVLGAEVATLQPFAAEVAAALGVLRGAGVAAAIAPLLPALPTTR